MSAYEHVTWICARTQESAKLLAVASTKSTSGDVPYLRKVRVFRVSGMHAMDVVPGDSIVDTLGRRLIVSLTDHRPDVPWSSMTTVQLRAVPVGLTGRGAVCVIQRPEDRSGIDARREDVVEHHDIECVFSRSSSVDTTEETVRQTTASDVCYLDRSIAEKLRQGWSIHDGATRWRVDRVSGLELLDRLPTVYVTATGAT